MLHSLLKRIPGDEQPILVLKQCIMDGQFRAVQFRAVGEALLWLRSDGIRKTGKTSAYNHWGNWNGFHGF